MAVKAASLVPRSRPPAYSAYLPRVSECVCVCWEGLACMRPRVSVHQASAHREGPLHRPAASESGRASGGYSAPGQLLAAREAEHGGDLPHVPHRLLARPAVRAPPPLRCAARGARRACMARMRGRASRRKTSTKAPLSPATSAGTLARSRALLRPRPRPVRRAFGCAGHRPLHLPERGFERPLADITKDYLDMRSQRTCQ